MRDTLLLKLRKNLEGNNMSRMIVINGCPYACIHQETMNFENLNKIFSDEYEIIYSKNVVFVNMKGD